MQNKFASSGSPTKTNLYGHSIGDHRQDPTQLELDNGSWVIKLDQTRPNLRKVWIVPRPSFDPETTNPTH